MVKAGCIVTISMSVIMVSLYLRLKFSGRKMPYEKEFLYNIMTTLVFLVFNLIVYVCINYIERKSITTVAAILM
jgi:hypothetical protein